MLLNNARSRGPLWKLAKVQSLLHFRFQYDSVLVFLCHTYKNVLFCFETSKWTKNLIRKGLDSILWLHSVVMSGGSFEDFLTASTDCLEWFSISVITRSSRKLRIESNKIAGVEKWPETSRYILLLSTRLDNLTCYQSPRDCCSVNVLNAPCGNNFLQLILKLEPSFGMKIFCSIDCYCFSFLCMLSFVYCISYIRRPAFNC